MDSEITRSISIEYNTDLFERATIERMIGQYLTILEGAATAPLTKLSALPLLSAKELALLQEWNATASIYPPGKIFPQLFEEQAARTPAAPAVCFNGVALSYSELNARANQVAHELRAVGAGPGMSVGLLVARSPLMIVALLGIQKSGAAYVPLDADFPLERIQYMLEDSGTKVLVTTRSSLRGLAISDEIRIVNLESSFSSRPITNPVAASGQRDPAYVIYTSGSTGRPKGVTVAHGAVVNFLWSMQQHIGLTSMDVMAAVTTISFDIAALELYLPLLVGARIELVPRETATNGQALSNLLTSRGVSVLQATPATWRLLIEASWPGGMGFRALSGGEALSRDLADTILDRADELWNLYGPTETTVWSAVERVERGDSAPSIGRPIANTEFHVLDKAGEPLPIEIAGEIHIGGGGVAIGYHRRPSLTAERFIPDRFSGRPGARLYRTGDLGRWGPDGKLYHLGRLDHQVKIRGFRIELGEIEAVLVSNPAVRQAVVKAFETQPGDQRLVAYILYRDGEDLTTSEVRRYLRGQLPEFMIPSMRRGA